MKEEEKRWRWEEKLFLWCLHF